MFTIILNFYLLEYQNTHVRVELFPESATIMCTYFRNETNTSCNVAINFGDSCQDRRELIGMRKSVELVSIDLMNFVQETMGFRYCNFTVIATSGTKLLYVEGDLSKSEDCDN